MALSIGPFPNLFPIGPCPPFHGLGVSPTKVLLGCLGLLLLPLLPCSSMFPVGSRSRWTYRNELADPLAKTEETLHFAHVSSTLAPVIAKIRHTRYITWRRNLSHKSLFCQIPSFSSEELVLPRLFRCELSWLRCLGYNLLLSFYVRSMKRKENFSCSEHHQ